MIDINTTVLQGGVDGHIVAYEKFSENYNLINTNLPYATYIPYIDSSNQLYALSSYDHRWGWGLVLPDNYTAHDLSKYYIFYRYRAGADNSQIEGIINWNDPTTTIPEYILTNEQWGSIIENMLTHTLAEGLEILSASE